MDKVRELSRSKLNFILYLFALLKYKDWAANIFHGAGILARGSIEQLHAVHTQFVMLRFKVLYPVSQKINFGTPDVPVLFNSYKHDISDCVYEYL